MKESLNHICYSIIGCKSKKILRKDMTGNKHL